MPDFIYKEIQTKVFLFHFLKRYTVDVKPGYVMDFQTVPLAMPGDDEAQACRIEFDLRYAFSSKALEAVLSPVFDRVANTFVDSFVRRAEDVYGAR